ncbi:hypothetical protein HMPREF1556_00388 [Porphyromonas sp. oral taxon 278 str. W7784]|nr:hypothetical protein HMPREF1556_00388 [Porphyromonas sp. oral taxon 278 str. W7784]
MHSGAKVHKLFRPSGAKTEQPPPYLRDIVEAVQSLQQEKLERR